MKRLACLALVTIASTVSAQNVLKNGDFESGTDFWTLVEVEGWDTGTDSPPHYPIKGVSGPHFCPVDYPYTHFLYFDVPAPEGKKAEAYAEQSARVPRGGAQLSMKVWGHLDQVTAVVSIIDEGGVEHVLDSFNPIVVEKPGGCSGDLPETKTYDVTSFGGQFVKVRLRGNSIEGHGAGTFADFDDVELVSTKIWMVNQDSDEEDVDLEDEKCDVQPATTDEDCTLRAAIQNANEYLGSIEFDKDSVVSPINVTSALPWISEAYTIDGTTNTPLGYVVIDGTNAEDTSHGLVANIKDVTLKGLNIRDFTIGVAALQAHNIRLDSVMVNNNDSLGLYLFETEGARFERGSASDNGVMGILIEDSKEVWIGGEEDGVEVNDNKGIGIHAKGGDHVKVLHSEVTSNDSTGIRIEGIFNVGIQSNTVSDNQDYGIRVLGSNNVYIGGGPETSNMIKGNETGGVLVADEAYDVRIRANDIVDNLGHGIEIENAWDNRIGDGGNEETGNLIHGNSGSGVVIRGENSVINGIRYNSIYSNGKIGIDLGDDGPTGNDLGDFAGPDTFDIDLGPNDLFNFPTAIHWGADFVSQKLRLTGLLETAAPDNSVVDLYASARKHASGRADAEKYLATVTPDANGYFTVMLNQSDIQGKPVISGIATSESGSSSEISLACGDPDGDGLVDSDGDGLCDDWEAPNGGIDYDGDGDVELVLSAYGASQDKRDIFVEYDWMQVGGHSHKPVEGAVDSVSRAFRAHDINLVFVEGEPTPEIEPVGFGKPPYDVTPAGHFDDIKWGNPRRPCSNEGSQAGKHGYFGPALQRDNDNCAALLGARRLAFRYMLFGHNHADQPGSSGIAELGGNDLMVTLGGWSDTSLLAMAGFARTATQYLTVARRRAEAGTIMHEFGHTLYLGHGGGYRDESGANYRASGLNCKPNYPSVMSYALQFQDLVPLRRLTYSDVRIDLHESMLREPVGLSLDVDGNTVPASTDTVIFNSSAFEGVADYHKAAIGQANIDWNNSGAVDTAAVDVDISDILNIGCNGLGFQELVGHDDWSDILFNFRTRKTQFGTGGGEDEESENVERTFEDVEQSASTFDYDGDGIANAFDNCSAFANPEQTDSDSDGIGDACESEAADLGLRIEARRPAGDSTMTTSDVRFDIWNQGPASATNVTLNDSLVGSVEDVSILDGASGCTFAGNRLSCVVDRIVAGDSVSITVRLTANEGTAVANTGIVASLENDPNPADNLATALFSVNVEGPDDLPGAFRLYENYPNPFMHATTIVFDVPKPSTVNITVHDVLGRVVTRLVSDEYRAGRHQIIWTPRVASGVYYVTMTAGSYRHTNEITLVR